MLSITTIVCSTAGLLTINMLNGIILGTTSTLNTIIYMLPSKNSDLNQYKARIEKLDIEFKLDIIKNWLSKEQTDTNKENMFNKLKDGIGDMCIKISDTLDDINKKISYHNTRWLSGWRKLYLDDIMKTLEEQCNILNERLNLIKLI